MGRTGRLLVQRCMPQFKKMALFIVFSKNLGVNTLWLFQATHILSLKADVGRDADNQLVEASVSQLERTSDIFFYHFLQHHPTQSLKVRECLT